MSGNNVSRRPLLRLRRNSAVCSNSCAKTPMKRSSIRCSPLRYPPLLADRKTPDGSSTSVGWIQLLESCPLCEPKFLLDSPPRAEFGQFNHDAANILLCEKLSPVNCM